ncbi:3',5'-cyclic AMP phosphodiesterase CpdA [Paenibacillus sp. UNCCL117]|uniref:metallophosphoesterase family protein n=1 Tax=unclassified Paenibacillus TaxID=185978 RepID=UPI00088C4737|nr:MULTISPECIES: metallophosphoesterase [unclassified Paenibacillus]SDE22011.1 3',5'-cyclic AMP phosphodiesterase CpdA [Paenibacillus sp. cl123]SFW43098.1 3',5'-cyclic AMP phosphodiesterase CpdA [Paenibacillus sp. UNCCL117]
MQKLLFILFAVPLLIVGSPAALPDVSPATDAVQAVPGKAPGTVSTAAAPAADPLQASGAQPSPDAKLLFAFSVLSDIHVEASDISSQRKLTAALNDLHQVNPDAAALIINGDLTNGTPADYSKLQSLLQKAPLPANVFYTIGNHEFYKAWLDDKGNYRKAGFPNNETDAASIGRFLQFAGGEKVYYAKTIQDHRFIFLGSEQYRQSNPDNGEDAYLSREQLDWLKAELAQAAAAQTPGHPIFVFLHQPLPYTVAGSQYYLNTRAVIQHEELKTILSAYPQVVYFSGHTHWELKLPNTLVRDGFTMVNSSSVDEPLTDHGPEGEKPVSDEASEGLYVEVYEDRLEIKGRDFHGKRWIDEAQFVVPSSSAAGAP